MKKIIYFTLLILLSTMIGCKALDFTKSESNSAQNPHFFITVTTYNPPIGGTYSGSVPVDQNMDFFMKLYFGSTMIRRYPQSNSLSLEPGDVRKSPLAINVTYIVPQSAIVNGILAFKIKIWDEDVNFNDLVQEVEEKIDFESFELYSNQKTTYEGPGGSYIKILYEKR